jgi:anti-anti-sigma regulatory factor
MLSTEAIASSATSHAAVFVDLIGDLDATLGGQFADTLANLTERGTTAVFLTTKHVNVSSIDGLAAIESALSVARARGCSVQVDPGNRRMRSAFASARIHCASDGPARPSRARHLMIARHSPATKVSLVA